MLNSSGEEVAAAPDDQNEKTVGSAILQIALIFVAGLYLFSIVWLYAQFPWLAVAGTAVAAAIVFSGLVRRIRGGPG